jgi:soluble lytic murein transglycosylase-like protein
MRHVYLAACILLLVGAGAGAMAQGLLAAPERACTAAQARQDVARAHHRLADAQRAYDEARHVLRATSFYSTHDYSDFAGRAVPPAQVGRWVRLARRAGWEWGQIDWLMHVVARESSGSASVGNGAGSGAAGLMQLMPGWYRGDWTIGGKTRVFDPFDPYLNLYWGHVIYSENGASPWSL